MAKVVIIGSGIAGLFAALRLADAKHTVTVITKQRPIDSSTNWAQGGIAAILDKTDGAGLESHIQDTLASGDGLCNERIVRKVIEESGERIHDLLNIGVRFETDENGAFSIPVLPGGTYAVGAILSKALRDQDYLDSTIVDVDLSSSNITDLNLTIAKPSEANFLSGTVKDSSGSVIEDAYVYAWSDDGREVSGPTSSDGTFSILVPAGSVWHIGAEHSVFDDNDGSENDSW